MEAKNFRVGNYVYDSFNNVVQLDLIILSNLDIMKIKPIPLTEEWIGKFGFEDSEFWELGGYEIDVLCDRFYLRPSFDDGYYWGWLTKKDNKKADCELEDVKALYYVHQLQNLFFAITGEELKITEKSAEL